MTFWEFEKNGKIVLDCEDDQEKIVKFLKNLEGKTLLDFQITSEDFRAQIEFEDGINLYFIPNNEEGGYEKWKLTVPGGQVFIAEPGSNLSIRE